MHDVSSKSMSRGAQIITGTKLFNIKYTFYGFSNDLIETIN